LEESVDEHRVFLGLGSNLGNREGYIRKAVALIEAYVGTVVRRSSLIETEPWGFESENRFLNGVILCKTALSPRELLKATQRIEKELGRKKKSKCLKVNSSKCRKTYSDRPIDIDILLYDDLTVDEPDLKIPHPLMHERDFVMIPLNEIKQ